MPRGPCTSNACGQLARCASAARAASSCHGNSGSQGSRAGSAVALARHAVQSQRRQMRVELGAHDGQRPRAVDDPEPAAARRRRARDRRRARARRMRSLRARTCRERGLRAAAASRRARETPVGTSNRNVTSGWQSPCTHCSSVADTGERHAVPAALVGVRRVGEAVAEHPVAPRERRPDHELEVLAPRREHQQRLAVAGHRLVQQQRAQLFAERRAAGLARGDDDAAARADARGKPGGMRALAGAVDAFERDEAAGCGKS